MNEILLQKNGNPWLTDENKTVPVKCPVCGKKMGLFLIGKPLPFFACITMEHYYGTVKFIPDEEDC